MNYKESFYLTSLINAKWKNPNNFVFPNSRSKLWLLDLGSLSVKLKQYCSEFTVRILHNEMLNVDLLTADEKTLLPHQDCLQRQVILCGDGIDWMAATTLIPQITLEDQEFNLAKQGDKPIGLTVFSAASTKRDQLQLAYINDGNMTLFARRSCLWINDKPLLVTEMFLPQAPIYDDCGIILNYT